MEAFGRPPRSGRGEQDVGYPQLRMVGLVECGTHAVFGTAIGALHTGEQALARAVLVSLQPGILLLADRGFSSVDLWRAAAATGADLLWRVRKDLVLPVIEQLPDGSYLTEIFDRSDIHHTRRGVPVRAVEYTVASHDGVYRLLTTILDPHMAPAAKLAALYAQRWEFESTLDGTWGCCRAVGMPWARRDGRVLRGPWVAKLHRLDLDRALPHTHRPPHRDTSAGHA